MQTNKMNNTNFSETKIKNLNRFFMRNIYVLTLLVIVLFLSTIAVLYFFLSAIEIEHEVRISLISIIITFIITSSRSLISKYISITVFLMNLLSEEQRGLSKSIGIEVNRIKYEDLEIFENENID